MKFKPMPLLLAGLAIAGGATAQPSGGFHWFKDKLTGQVLCAQYAQTPDLVQLPGGPFQDEQCKVPEPPKSEPKDKPAIPPGLILKK